MHQNLDARRLGLRSHLSSSRVSESDLACLRTKRTSQHPENQCSFNTQHTTHSHEACAEVSQMLETVRAQRGNALQ